MKRFLCMALLAFFVGGIVLSGGNADVNEGQADDCLLCEDTDIRGEIVSEIFCDENTQFEYKILTLTGFSNKEVELKANDTLRHELTDWVDEESSWLKDASIELIKNSAHYVTIKLSCESFGNRYDVLNTYVTIDTETGAFPDWEDIIGSKEDIITILRQEFPEMSDNMLTDLLQSALMSNKDYRELTKTRNSFSAFLFKPSFYISEDCVFLKHNSIEADDINVKILTQDGTHGDSSAMLAD